MADDQERREIARALSLVGELGLTVVVALLITAAAGNYLDRRLGTSPYLTALGAALGLAGGLWRCYRRIAEFLE